jgi:hypothetical protein
LFVVEPFPLTYENFSAMPLDHTFWNNGLYYHLKAPWAINAEVCTGIKCALILSQIQEEFELIVQELAQVVGWAITTHDDMSNCITQMVAGMLDSIFFSYTHVNLFYAWWWW